jgi:hypothetical protein
LECHMSLYDSVGCIINPLPSWGFADCLTLW